MKLYSLDGCNDRFELIQSIKITIVYYLGNVFMDIAIHFTKHLVVL